MSGSGAAPGASDKNVLTVVRVRPVPAGTEVCWSTSPETPRQIALLGAQARQTLTFGLGE